MMRAIPTLLLVGLLGLLPPVAIQAGLARAQSLGGGPVQGTDPPMAVLTDTPEFCAQLAHWITEQPSRNVEVKHLLHEGRQLCDGGQVRMGIARLRRALLILHRKPVPVEHW
jgi:hypothetical protein